MSLVSMLIAFCSRRDELMNFFSRNMEQVFTCAMFLEKKFISSSLTHCHACATTTCLKKKAISQLTSGIMLSGSMYISHIS